MRILSLLLLVAVAVPAESYASNFNKHAQRDVLVRSKRRWVLSTIELVEEKEADYPIEISRLFNDKTEGKNYKFHLAGEGVSEGIFSVDEETGVVFANRPVDREEKHSYHITFEVLEKETSEQIDKELSFDVDIADINDNAPVFHQSKIVANVKENMPEGYLPVQLKVVDPDQPNTPNSAFTLTVLSQTPVEPKIEVDRLDDMLAQLAFTGCFDYQKQNQYKIIIEAKDQGEPQLSSYAVVTINILDSNTHQPTFKQKKYEGEAHEMATKSDILRVSVEDKDTPNTDAWRAKYFFISGNEDETFTIETDPKTNEGVLNVVKGKNYKETTLKNLKIGVENIEPLFVCKDGKPVSAELHPKPDSVTIEIKMIDTNDPPTFGKDKIDVHVTEEEEPGKLLFTPDVHDDDSKNIRFELINDPAGWVTIDKATGKITSIKRMDRESDFVDKNNIYSVVIAAIDDGEPPGTATANIKIHLSDINDNKPQLVNKTAYMCMNKHNKVMVHVKDADQNPYSGPFTFTLRGDENLKKNWKLSPSFGMMSGLVNVKALPYGNYSIPLHIQDQQNQVGEQILHLRLCDCEDKDVCRDKLPLSVGLGPAAIGLLIGALLLVSILIPALLLKNGKKLFENIEIDGQQTLINYNEEGGGAACMAVPTLIRTPTSDVNVMQEVKQATLRTTKAGQGLAEVDGYNRAGIGTLNSNFQSMGMYNQTEAIKNEISRNSRNTQSMYTTWGASRNSRTNYNTSSSSKYQHSVGLQSNQLMADRIESRLYVINGNNDEVSVDRLSKFAYEGQGSKCQSLDELSLIDPNDNLQFLDDLGQKFKTLGKICQKTIEEKNIQV